jgi:hypothetical protein
MRKALLVVLMVGFLTSGVAIGFTVAEATQSTATGNAVVGRESQVYLLMVPTTTCRNPCNQPDTTPFQIPGTQVTITVPPNSNAVVSIEASFSGQGINSDSYCAPSTTGGSGAPMNYVVLVDGQPVSTTNTPGQAFLGIIWTAPIGRGTHTVASGFVCPPGTGGNPSADWYEVNGPGGSGPAPMRVEQINLPGGSGQGAHS